MNQASSALDAAWREAIGAAPTRDISVFVEERDDLVVEADSASCSARVVPTRTSGLNVSEWQAGGKSLYLSGARPEDLAPCLDRLRRGAAAPTEAFAGYSGEFVPLDPATTLDLVTNTLDRLRSRLAATPVRIVWAGFCQHIWTHGRRGTVAETRRAARLRLEADMGVGGPLTAEIALRPGRPAADSALSALIDRMAERAGAFRVAVSGRSGEFEVVLAAGVGGILAHELVGHALEADTVLSGRSWLGRPGQTRFPADLTVLDDPRRGRAAWQSDDEGEQAIATALLRDGRVGDWLHDLRSSARCNRASNGHGRRASFREPVRPRMGCTFVANGKQEPDELIAGIAEGIYVRRMESATTDTTNGRAAFRVADADRIVKGKIAQALRPFVMIVDGAQTLTRLDQIGNDLAFDTCIGGCHRDGQPLAVSVGAPTICIGVVKVVC